MGVVLLYSALIWGSFFCILQRFGGRFAMFCKALGGRFAALYNDLGVVLLRSVTVWGVVFAAFCIDLGVVLLRSATIGGSFYCVLFWGCSAATRIDLGSFCYVPH